MLKLVRDAIVETTGIQVQGRPRIVDWVKQTLYGTDPSLLEVSSSLITAYERTAYAEEQGERVVIVNHSAPYNNQAGEQTSASDAARTFVTNEHESSARRATSVAQRFTDERKYDGSPSSDLTAVIARYNDCRADYSLTDTEMRRFAHNLFSGDAKRFYDTDLSIRRTPTIDGVVQAMTSHFIHASQRNAVTAELRAQSIAKELKSVPDTKEALVAIYRRIEKLNPMCSPEFVGDRHKGSFLRHAVLSEAWARCVLRACAQYTASQNMTFATLYQLLNSAIVQQQEIDEARLQAMQHQHDISYVDPKDSFYGGRFANRIPSSKSRPSFRGGARRSFHTSRPRDKSSVQCFKCSTRGHFANECPTKRDMSMIDAVRARVKRYGGDPQAVAETLYEVAEYSDLQEEFGDADLVTTGIFEALFEDEIKEVDEGDKSDTQRQSFL
jgi:Zinc knuckle